MEMAKHSMKRLVCNSCKHTNKHLLCFVTMIQRLNLYYLRFRFYAKLGEERGIISEVDIQLCESVSIATVKSTQGRI